MGMIAAIGMIASNTFVTVAYFCHERLGAGIKWGIQLQKDS